MDRVSAGAKSELFILSGLPVFFGIAGSLFAVSIPAALAVSAGLALFCLPGVFFTGFADPERSLPPALRLAVIGITGYFLSTCTGIAIRLVFPDAHAAVLIVPGAAVLAAAGVTRLRRHGRCTPRDDTHPKVSGSSPRIKRLDLLFLTLLLLFALAAVLPPLANIGREYPEGEFYRAYFNVDYLKHVAVTGNLAHSEIPPDNPYLKTEEPLHYYWFFYIFPASFRALDLPGIDTLDILRVVTIWGILAFCLFLYGFCRYLSDYPASAFLAALCGIFAFSYEGLFLLRRMVSDGDPILQGIGKYNVDAATRWFIGHPQIDGLFRTLIFTPQHLFGLMLFCLSLLLLIRSLEKPARPSIRILWFTGLLAGLNFGFSSFIAIIGYIWLTVAGIVIAGRRRDLRIGFHLALALGIAGLIMIGLGILYRRPESMVFSPQTAVIRRLPMFLLYNFGPLILLFPLGLVRSFRRHRLPAWNLLFLLALCMFFILFVQISGFPTDMGIKLGLIVSVLFVFFLAIGLSPESGTIRAAFQILALLLALPALPTLFLDVFNSCDTTNARYSFLAERADLAACRWIRDHLPEHIRVQSDPYARYEACSIIPTFAERRTVAGDKMHARIFLSDPADFEKAEREVGRLFAQTDPEAAARIMRDLGIDYVFVGRTERAKYPGATELFNNFVAVYRSDGVSVHSSRPLASMNDASFKILPRLSPPETKPPMPISESIPAEVGERIELIRSKTPDLSSVQIATFAVLESFDPVTPHHFMVKGFLVQPETSRRRFGNNIFRLEPRESRRFNMGAFDIPNEFENDDYTVRLELYHVPDSMDSFLPREYSIVDMHRRFHTTGVTEGEGDSAQVVARYPDHAPGIVARGGFGVLPAGDYTLIIPLSGFEKADWTIIVEDRTTIRPWSESVNTDEIGMHFELKHPSDTQLELRLVEGGNLSARSVRLDWTEWNPCPEPLAIVEIRVPPEIP